MNRAHSIGVRPELAVLLAILASCSSSAVAPALPERKDFSGVVTRTFAPYDLSGRTVTGLILQENVAMRAGMAGEGRVGIAVEDPPVPVVGMVTAVVDGREVAYLDQVHSPGISQALLGRKLPASEFGFSAGCGGLTADYRFLPQRDVLCSLDRGFKVTVARDGAADSLVLKPLYDSSLYSPYGVAGASKAPGDTGFSPGGAYYNAYLNGGAGAGGGYGQRGGNGGSGADASQLGECGGAGGPGGGGGAGYAGQDGYAAYEAGGTGGGTAGQVVTAAGPRTASGARTVPASTWLSGRSTASSIWTKSWSTWRSLRPGPTSGVATTRCAH
ncbi:MAG: hypothetical protein FJ109_09035 [Deltaproteobacteria bacterium]|nr:hypothetical protein [Deltaproteobacteria bacterium]